MNPDRISIRININGPGDPLMPEDVDLDVNLASQGMHAYGRLLLEALEGDPTFFIRGDEAEESWRIVEAIRQAWRDGRRKLLEYPAGSEGLAEAESSAP